jgi:hypothetical protein
MTNFLYKTYQIFNNKIAIYFFLTLFFMFLSRIVVENTINAVRNKEKVNIPTNFEANLNK